MTLRSSSSGMSSSNLSRVQCGAATPASNGILSSFNFAHGMASMPLYVSVTARNVLSGGAFSTNWDATNITITYLVTPDLGTLSFSWIACS